MRIATIANRNNNVREIRLTAMTPEETDLLNRLTDALNSKQGKFEIVIDCAQTDYALIESVESPALGATRDE